MGSFVMSLIHCYLAYCYCYCYCYYHHYHFWPDWKIHVCLYDSVLPCTALCILRAPQACKEVCHNPPHLPWTFTPHTQALRHYTLSQLLLAHWPQSRRANPRAVRQLQDSLRTGSTFNRSGPPGSRSGHRRGYVRMSGLGFLGDRSRRGEGRKTLWQDELRSFARGSDITSTQLNCYLLLLMFQ